MGAMRLAAPLHVLARMQVPLFCCYPTPMASSRIWRHHHQLRSPFRIWRTGSCCHQGWSTQCCTMGVGGCGAGSHTGEGAQVTGTGRHRGRQESKRQAVVLPSAFLSHQLSAAAEQAVQTALEQKRVGEPQSASRAHGRAPREMLSRYQYARGWVNPKRNCIVEAAGWKRSS